MDMGRRKRLPVLPKPKKFEEGAFFFGVAGISDQLKSMCVCVQSSSSSSTSSPPLHTKKTFVLLPRSQRVLSKIRGYVKVSSVSVGSPLRTYKPKRSRIETRSSATSTHTCTSCCLLFSPLSSLSHFGVGSDCLLRLFLFCGFAGDGLNRQKKAKIF